MRQEHDVKRIATWLREKDEPIFAQWFPPTSGVTLLNARTSNVDPAECDALLLSGGSDISLPFLQQPVPNPKLIEEPDWARDLWEFHAVQVAFTQHFPFLAICRGLQVMAVASGGSLHLDIPHHAHLRDEDTQPLRHASQVNPWLTHVNSSHHQAIDRLPPFFCVEAWCANDGVIEQIRARTSIFQFGVQYHPERHPRYAPIFEEFLHAVHTR